MTVLIGMFLLGLLIALGSWVVSWSDHVKDQLEVKVFLVEDVTPKQANAVQRYLAQQKVAGTGEGVPVRLEGRGAAADAQEVSRADGEPPLESATRLVRGDPQQGRGREGSVRRDPAAEVRRASSASRTASRPRKRILQVARVIEVIFLVAVIVLLIASVLLIANTIRLSIFSRRREIEVMKLVGATNWFVRGPFMVEGSHLRRARRDRRDRAPVARQGGRAARDPRSHRHHVDDVRALTFSLIALILLAVGLGVGALGLRRHVAALPARLICLGERQIRIADLGIRCSESRRRDDPRDRRLARRTSLAL